jgi:hypothetical protein
VLAHVPASRFVSQVEASSKSSRQSRWSPVSLSSVACVRGEARCAGCACMAERARCGAVPRAVRPRSWPVRPRACCRARRRVPLADVGMTLAANRACILVTTPWKTTRRAPTDLFDSHSRADRSDRSCTRRMNRISLILLTCYDLMRILSN